MRPFTVAFVGSKGGCGRSTLSTALAAHAVGEGLKVGLVDMDAQGSTTLWHGMRGSPDNPKLVDFGKAAKVDVTIIDAPPSNLSVVERCIRAADVCVLPLRAGAFDIASTKDTVNICRDVGRHYLLVLNAVDIRRRELITEAMKSLRQLGPTLGTVIENRAIYVTTLHRGLTGPEALQGVTKPGSALRLDTEGAAEEITELWKAILTVLKHARKSS